jgi:hypothetical protein
MIIYTHSRSKRKKSKSKRLAQATAEHKAFLASVGYVKRRRTVADFPNLKGENDVERNVAPVSNAIPANGFKRSVDDWKWRRDRQESVGTIQEIERKKKQVAPLWNKGATMFISDQTDPTTLGRKV